MSLLSLPVEHYCFSTDVVGWSFVSCFFSINQYTVIKSCFFGANPKEENNRQDNITKVQSLPKKVHQLRTKYWRIGRGVGIDKSQACFGSRYARCLHRGETKMPIFDYINIIAAHLSNSIFCYTLYMDKQEHTIVKMILGL